MKVYNRFTNELIIEVDNIKTGLREADLYEANLRRANLYEAILWGANLRKADLYEANLRRANLYEAILWGADLGGADLHRANLREANIHEAILWGADLGGADLQVKYPSIDDHFFISEILFRAAQTENQKNFAARIRFELNSCWEDFLKLALKIKVYKWAKEILSQWPEFEEKIKEVYNGK